MWGGLRGVRVLAPCLGEGSKDLRGVSLLNLYGAVDHPLGVSEHPNRTNIRTG